MTTHHLVLCPRDGLFCKDGRGWRSGENGRGQALRWPHPSTVLGALRAAYGRTQERAQGRTWPREAWKQGTKGVRIDAILTLARALHEPWGLAHRRWPTPHDAVYCQGEGEPTSSVRALVPERSTVATLGRDDDAAREALWRPRALERGKPPPRPRWWREEDFVRWLCAEELGSAPVDHDPLLRVDAHLQIDPLTQAALESRLFSREIVETITMEHGTAVEWALAVGVELPQASIDSPVVLGGDRRLCSLEPASAALFQMPGVLREAFDRTRSTRLRLIAVTAAGFAQGWVPDFLARHGDVWRGPLADVELELRAAAVPRPVDVAGWDMAEGCPKPLMRMVAPGSVYWLERTDGGLIDGALAEELWLCSMGRDQAEGFGLVVPGVWKSEQGAVSC